MCVARHKYKREKKKNHTFTTQTRRNKPIRKGRTNQFKIIFFPSFCFLQFEQCTQSKVPFLQCFFGCLFYLQKRNLGIVCKLVYDIFMNHNQKYIQRSKKKTITVNINQNDSIRMRIMK